MSGAGAAARAETVHATCVAVGGDGVLIRGPSGRGKSTLARLLVATGARRGVHALLVGDDRVRLAAEGDRLVARPHPAIAGLMEVRGVGIVWTPHAPRCDVRLVLDLQEDGSGAGQGFVNLLGLTVPWVSAPRGEAAEAAWRRLRGLHDTIVTIP